MAVLSVLSFNWFQSTFLACNFPLVYLELGYKELMNSPCLSQVVVGSELVAIVIPKNELADLESAILAA